MNRLGKALLALLLAIVLLPSAAFGSEQKGPIEISSLDDIKPYLHTVQKNNGETDYTLLAWKGGSYVLTQDIEIDEDDPFFQEHTADIQKGLFAVDEEFSLDGQGHTIKLVKDKGHSLFSEFSVGEYTDPANPNVAHSAFTLTNFSLVTAGDVICTPFAYSLKGYSEKGVTRSNVSNISVVVNGDVLPMYIYEGRSKPGYNMVANRLNCSVGFAIDVNEVQLHDVNLHVKGNIGKLGAPVDEDGYVGQSFGFVRGANAEFASNSATLKQYGVEESKDVTAVGNVIYQAGGIKDVTVVVDGSVIASGNIKGSAGAFADTLDAPVTNTHVHVKGDVHRHAVGGEYPHTEDQLRGQEDFVVGLARTTCFAQNVDVVIDGKFNFTQDSPVVTSKTNHAAMSSCGPWQKSLGKINVYTNNTIEVKGGLDTQGLSSGFAFFGVFGNDWGNNIDSYDHFIYNNHAKMGNITINVPSYIYFDGITRRGKIPDPNKPSQVLVQENMSAEYGDITLISDSYINGALIARNFGDKTPSEVLPVKDYKVTAGNIVIKRTGKGERYLNRDFMFSLGLLYNYNSAENLEVKTGDVTVVDNGVGNKNAYLTGLVASNSSGATLTNSRISTGKIDMTSNAKYVFAAGLTGYDKGEVKDSSGCFDGLSVTGTQTDAGATDYMYVGGAVGYGKGNSLANTPVFYKDSFEVAGGLNTDRVGGLIGYAVGSTVDNAAVQIGEDLNVTAPKYAFVGGLVGSFSSLNNKGSISKSTSLIFGDMDLGNPDSPQSSVGAGYGVGLIGAPQNQPNATLTDCAGYVGGNFIAPQGDNSLLGGSVGFLQSGASVDNYTMIQNKGAAENKLTLKDYLINPAGGQLTNAHYVLVSNGERVAYSIPDEMLRVDEDGNPLLTAETEAQFLADTNNVVGVTSVEPRAYQATYWGKDAERKDFKPETSGYITNKTVDALELISPNKDIASSDASKVNVKTFCDRHLAVQNNGITYDIFGIPDHYSVMYDGNGNTAGQPPVDPNAYEPNDAVTVLAQPQEMVKDGFTFAGWNTKADGSGTTFKADDTFTLSDVELTTIEGPNGTKYQVVMLYAKWEPIKYIVTYHENMGTGKVPVDEKHYVAGEKVTVADKGGLSKENYVFTGWNTKADGSGTAYQPGDELTMPEANVDLYAQWKEKETPVEPNQPDTPDTPDQPDTPYKPDQPDTPDKPDQPDKPEQPDKSDTPDKPEYVPPYTPPYVEYYEKPHFIPKTNDVSTGHLVGLGVGAVVLVLIGGGILLKRSRVH